ncbi:suppressor of fused domain protein [Micromonospora sp. 067-2]|uniref:suppressor of fused domain protein n=1 Tax=Micromonospora sp. 067-2 TaxID=2789270 RepID=UPI00397DF3D6
MSLLVAHLESRLGKIQAGWTRDPEGVELPFQVAEFRGGGQLVGSTSYSTLGLSRHSLPSPSGDREMSLEFVMSTHSALAPARFPQSLQFLAQDLLRRHVAILRGQTFTLPWPVADGSAMSNIYAAVPGYFDEDFDSVELEDGRGVAVIWMIPISDAENTFVTDCGWDAFERELVERDPDLLDLNRRSVF